MLLCLLFPSFLCVWELSWSWLALSLSPVAPLALWQWLWPVHLPPTVWVWWERGHGRPLAPLSNLLPTEHPHQPPGQLLRPQNLHSSARWAPGHTVTRRSAQTHTRTLTIPTHMLSKPLYKWKPCNTHGYTGGPHEEKKKKNFLSYTHILHVCQPFNTQSSQAQVFPTAPYNGLSSQGWDTNRWRCFLY